MTPERREELRRADDALISARYNLDRKSYLVTIAAQEDRIKALESLLVRCAGIMIVMDTLCEEAGYRFQEADELRVEIDAILPATEDKKDEA